MRRAIWLDNQQRKLLLVPKARQGSKIFAFFVLLAVLKLFLLLFLFKGEKKYVWVKKRRQFQQLFSSPLFLFYFFYDGAILNRKKCL